METKSNKPMPFKHISDSATEILNYIDKRRRKLINPLVTRWPKFNKLIGGGFEWGTVISIAGISGSGKSSFINTLETDLIDLNPKEDLVILAFSFEMISAKQVGRKLSYKLKKTTSELYSGESLISDIEYDYIESTTDDIKEYPIYYVDDPGTVEDIESTISFFQETIAKNKWLIVTIDHTLLVNGAEGERAIIANLQKTLIRRKKIGKTTIIQLSQMNRNIESTDRINNPLLHYPQRGDLSSSDSVFQGSDIVIVIHRPEILGLMSYGVKNMSVKDAIYLHFLKNREGSIKILRFINDLKYNNIKEPEDDDPQGQQQIDFKKE